MTAKEPEPKKKPRVEEEPELADPFKLLGPITCGGTFLGALKSADDKFTIVKPGGASIKPNKSAGSAANNGV